MIEAAKFCVYTNTGEQDVLEHLGGHCCCMVTSPSHGAGTPQCPAPLVLAVMQLSREYCPSCKQL